MFLRMPIKSRAFFPLAFFILFAASQVQAAVTVDSRNSQGAFSNTGVSSISWTHTVGSGSNSALYVTVSTTNAAAIPPVCQIVPSCQPLPGIFSPVMSVTDNGTPMNQVVGHFSISGSIINTVGIYRRVSPPTGANNIVVNFVFVPGVVTHAVGNSVSFFGVNQAMPDGNNTASGFGEGSSTLSISVAGGATGDMVIDVLASTPNAGFFVEGAGQTVCTDPIDETTCTRGRRFFFTAYDVGASSTEPVTTPPTTMSWTMTASASWAIAATRINAAPTVTAAAVSVSGRVVAGKGRGVSRARVVITNVNTGETKYAATNPFGYYRFTDVSAGATYSIEVRHKRFQFPPQVVTVVDEVENLNFTTQP